MPFLCWAFKHVLSSISIHISLVIPIPSKTGLQMERLMRNFLWSANSKKRCSNFIRLETVCLPKFEGGLGLRSVKEVNDAYLMKVGWTAARADFLWAEWFKPRYFNRSSIWDGRNPKGGSCIWKRLRFLSRKTTNGS